MAKAKSKGRAKPPAARPAKAAVNVVLASERKAVLRRAFALLRQVPTDVVNAWIPVFEEKTVALPGMARMPGAASQQKTYAFTGDQLDTLDCLIGCATGVESPASSEICTWINNEGDADDRAASLLAVLPIAERLYERLEAEKASRRQASAKQEE